MKKIKVTYIDDRDDYRDLWNMSKEELIGIIKLNDNIIDRLNGGK